MMLKIRATVNDKPERINEEIILESCLGELRKITKYLIRNSRNRVRDLKL
jgi:hypothetical protein